jgi:hemerythrin superfamily protein
MKTSNQEMDPLDDVYPDDAIGMLIADHKRVANLFAQFKRLTSMGKDEDKAPVVKQICHELTIHTQLEEELFYPAVRRATKDDDQMDEARVEHAGAKHLISQLAGADPDDDLYDAKVRVLSEQIEHHVEEEEGSMFPKARYSGLDTLALGAAMLTRKAELVSGATNGMAPPPAEPGKDDKNADVGEEDKAPNMPHATSKKTTATHKATKPGKKRRR